MDEIELVSFTIYRMHIHIYYICIFYLLSQCMRARSPGLTGLKVLHPTHNKWLRALRVLRTRFANFVLHKDIIPENVRSLWNAFCNAVHARAMRPILNARYPKLWYPALYYILHFGRSNIGQRLMQRRWKPSAERWWQRLNFVVYMAMCFVRTSEVVAGGD